MRRIDQSPPALPDINPQKICFIAALAREIFVGEDTPASRQARAELIQYIDDLDDDEAAALVALDWIGRGDFSADDAEAAVEQARARRQGSTATYLLGDPLLASYLEAALDAFGRSCDDFEDDEV